ncbi:MAG: GNAT family N-acetyltransferase [Propionibacteriaceae bacterium]|nr:GNAT family N-acetyltransferase [Propionibacteriaceae bacterium]
MSIIVRTANEEDLPVIRDHLAQTDPRLVDEHFRLQREGLMYFAVALDHAENDALVGTALLDLNSEMTPELRNMFVAPSARRRGAGRALSQWIEQKAREAGHTAVFLAVDPNNEKAVPLYVSLEYHPTGEHLFVKEPEVQQVPDPSRASSHYAIYKKSLTAR